MYSSNVAYMIYNIYFLLMLKRMFSSQELEGTLRLYPCACQELTVSWMLEDQETPEWKMQERSSHMAIAVAREQDVHTNS